MSVSLQHHRRFARAPQAGRLGETPANVHRDAGVGVRANRQVAAACRRLNCRGHDGGCGDRVRPARGRSRVGSPCVADAAGKPACTSPTASSSTSSGAPQLPMSTRSVTWPRICIPFHATGPSGAPRAAGSFRKRSPTPPHARAPTSDDQTDTHDPHRARVGVTRGELCSRRERKPPSDRRLYAADPS